VNQRLLAMSFSRFGTRDGRDVFSDDFAIAMNVRSGSCEKFDSPTLRPDQKCLPMCQKSLVGHLNAHCLGAQIGYFSEINFFSASCPNVAGNDPKLKPLVLRFWRVGIENRRTEANSVY